MCMACEEMQLFYAYLDSVEEAKRKAQPWQCEVIVIPQAEEPASAAPAGRFACDDGTDAPASAGAMRAPTKP
jgi:hypothetical protein